MNIWSAILGICKLEYNCRVLGVFAMDVVIVSEVLPHRQGKDTFIKMYPEEEDDLHSFQYAATHLCHHRIYVEEMEVLRW